MQKLAEFHLVDSCVTPLLPLPEGLHVCCSAVDPSMHDQIGSDTLEQITCGLPVIDWQTVQHVHWVQEKLFSCQLSHDSSHQKPIVINEARIRLLEFLHHLCSWQQFRLTLFSNSTLKFANPGSSRTVSYPSSCYSYSWIWFGLKFWYVLPSIANSDLPTSI